MWFCDRCDKSINIKNKSKHIKSKYHKCCEKFNVFVKEYEFIRPNIDKVDSKIDNSLRDCYKKDFDTLRTVYDFEMEDGDSVTSINYAKKANNSKSWFYTKTNNNNLSTINKHCFLKHEIPIMHRRFF